MSLVHRKSGMKGERHLRIKAQLIAGVAPSDIARSEGVSRQWVHQVKQALAEQGLDDKASVKAVKAEPVSIG